MIQSKVGIVILNYMTYDLTLRCVEKLARLAHDDYFLVVVDNQSPNDSGKVLAEAFASGESHGHPVYFLQSDINGGYSAGNNLGIKKAEALGAEYVVVMNNDVEILDPFILSKAVTLFSEDPALALIGPGIVEKGRLLPPAFSKRPNGITTILYNLFFPFCVLGLKIINNRNFGSQNAQKVYSVAGSFMILRTSHFRTVGYFDEHVFLFSEELILGEKLHRAKLSARFQPDWKIDHQHSATIKERFRTIERAQILDTSVNYYYDQYRPDIGKGIRQLVKISSSIKTSIYLRIFKS